MTPKQSERLRKKIDNIKRTLFAEKKKFGAYDDSRGLRYLPTKYYIQLGDFSGGHTYTKWFEKNFPDDCGFPGFLFEWTIILFKTDNLKKAEKKAFETFCSNTYLFDKFFGRPITPVDKYEGSNLESLFFTNHFDYISGQTELADFSNWLKLFIADEKFINLSTKYVDIHKRLKTEQDYKTRHYLVRQASQLADKI